MKAAMLVQSHGLNRNQFQSFCAELMLNMGRSCTLHNADDQVLGLLKIFFNIEARNTVKLQSIISVCVVFPQKLPI
jgi:hypothetical protein